MKSKSSLFLFVFLLSGLVSFTSREYDFRFFAIGDMPYRVPEDFGRFEKLISAINKERPAFTVHVGDIKAGKNPCSDAYYEKIYGYFRNFKQPLIYVPGDNEWTDCHREGAGGYDPVERLQKVRSVFYKDNKSLGQQKLDLLTLNSYTGFEKFVENAIWEKRAVTFATLHVVGSNNNLKTDSAATNEEYKERNAANLFWLEETFNRAKLNQSRGIVLFLHAALNYKDTEHNGFRDFTRKLRQEALAYHKPILLVYGDHHRFQVDKPLRDDEGKVIPNFTSVMVFGDPDIHGVEIRVNKHYPSLFEIRQFLVSGN